MTIESCDVDLWELVQTVASLHAASAHGKEIDVVTVIDPDLPRFVSTDPSRLRQILSNLLGNAVKFTSEGYVAIKLRRDGNAFELAVQDTGIGISEEQRERLFQPFQQADGSTTRRFGGTGLGLTISAQLAQLLGGSIDIQSTPGTGTTFTVRLPLEAATRATPTIDEPELTGSTICIIDPCEATQSSVEAWVRSWGGQVVRAADEPERVDLLVVGHCASVGSPDLSKAPRAGARIELRPLNLASDTDVAPSKELTVITKPVAVRELSRAIRRALTDEIGPVDPARPAAAPAVRSGRGKVLIAEDNPVNQLVSRRMVEKLGFEVKIAADGQAALEAVQAEHFDVVLMDCLMPVMDGFESTAAIRALGDAGTLPIIALTANAMKGDRERCMDAGMDDYLTKPIAPDELDRAMERWIQRAAA